VLDDAISILASTAAAQPFTDAVDEEDDEDSGSGGTSPVAAADRLLMQKMNSKISLCKFAFAIIVRLIFPKYDRLGR
jgi:hypothetical protein